MPAVVLASMTQLAPSEHGPTSFDQERIREQVTRPTRDEMGQSELALEKASDNPTLNATADPEDADKLQDETREETPVGDSTVANPSTTGEREVQVLQDSAGEEVAMGPTFEQPNADSVDAVLR